MSLDVQFCIKSKQMFSCAKTDLGHLQIKYNNIFISLHYYLTINVILLLQVKVGGFCLFVWGFFGGYFGIF